MDIMAAGTTVAEATAADTMDVGRWARAALKGVVSQDAVRSRASTVAADSMAAAVPMVAADLMVADAGNEPPDIE